jgi:hypothetical protein
MLSGNPACAIPRTTTTALVTTKSGHSAGRPITARAQLPVEHVFPRECGPRTPQEPATRSLSARCFLRQKKASEEVRKQRRGPQTDLNLRLFTSSS